MKINKHVKWKGWLEIKLYFESLFFEQINKKIREKIGRYIIVIFCCAVFIAFYYWNLSWVLESGFFNNIFNFKKENPLPFWIIFWALFPIVMYQLIKVFKKEIEIQSINKQPSWVYYLCLSFSFGLLFLLFLIFRELIDIRKKFAGDIDFMYFIDSRFGGVLLFFLLALIGYIFWYKKIKKEKVIKDLSKERFSVDSVEKEEDKLDFKNVAEKIAKNIEEEKKFVSVYQVIGEIGFGKSSFVRMIVESFKKENILYTYLSFAETNETKDFLKLFSERWTETLKKRYPKIDAPFFLPILQSITRESGNGFLSLFLGFLSYFNGGLLKIKGKYFDNFFPKKKEEFVSNNIRKIFGGIPKFSEKQWIVVIEEIERAKFEEVSRLFEILERFKNEGRSGIPIRVVFILSVDINSLEKEIEIFKDKNQDAYFIENFINMKGVDGRIWIPYRPKQIRNFIKNEYKKSISDFNAYFSEEYRIEVDEEDIEKAIPDFLTDPRRNFISKKFDRFSYLLGILSSESPRAIKKIISGAFFYYKLLQEGKGEAKINIGFEDFILMEYIKFHYPFLMDFFLKAFEIERIKNFFDKEINAENWHERTRRDIEFGRFNANNSTVEFSLINSIEKTTKKEINGWEKEKIEKLVCFIAYPYSVYITKENYDPLEYANTLALPDHLYTYLSMQKNTLEFSLFEKMNLIYNLHKNGNLVFEDLKDRELLGYSKFLFDVENSDSNYNFELLKELKERIIKGEKISEFAYQFCFQCVAMTEKNEEGYIEEILSALESIFKSEDVSTEMKFLILHSFVNNRRSNSNIHVRLKSSFNKIKESNEKKIKELISYVFKEAEDRYFDNPEGVIYGKETNPFFVLYQYWSGKKENKKEIDKIRDVARRGLQNNDLILEKYWDRYEKCKNGSDLISRSFMEDNSNEVYMPLDGLIDITKNSGVFKNNVDLHDKVVFYDNPDVQTEDWKRKRSVIQDDNATLKCVLLDEGLLERNLILGEK